MRTSNRLVLGTALLGLIAASAASCGPTESTCAERGDCRNPCDDPAYAEKYPAACPDAGTGGTGGHPGQGGGGGASVGLLVWSSAVTLQDCEVHAAEGGKGGNGGNGGAGSVGQPGHGGGIAIVLPMEDARRFAALLSQWTMATHTRTSERSRPPTELTLALLTIRLQRGLLREWA